MITIFIGACFFLSGMASLAYQSVWMREAMGQFGVITPVLSTVLVVFMAGLAIGTAWGARFVSKKDGRAVLRLYGLTELGIALSALTVAPLLRFLADASAIYVAGSASAEFLLISQGMIALAMLVPCILIGLTLPLGMRFLETQAARHAFSHLYLFNLTGAVAGCALPLFVVELLGFRATTYVFAIANLLAAAIAFLLVSRLQADTKIEAEKPASKALSKEHAVLLFATGAIAMGAETIWLKSYIPVLGSSVYSFSLVLITYLLFNYLGANYYKQAMKKSEEKARQLYHHALFFLPIAVACSVLAISVESFRILSVGSLLLLGPLCFACGIILPHVMDEACKDNSAGVYRAYRWNFLGCVLGPLLSTYVLFGWFGFKGTLMVYAALAALVIVWLARSSAFVFQPRRLVVVLSAALVGLSVAMPDFEAHLAPLGNLYRDHVGSVIAISDPQARIFVNGIGMTVKTTITKNMAHLPLAHLNHTPKKALAICFGMGTTVRSFASWPLENIYAAELSSGVLQAFENFHADAAEIRKDPRVHLVADDGRRFLKRTDQRFDVITIDPPPPIYAAGSGLLYTREFLALIKSRLAEGGILQHWIPDGDDVLHAAIYNALRKHFSHVKMLDSIEGWGVHFLASDAPIKEMNSAEFAKALPEKAQRDFMEWAGQRSFEEATSLSLRPLPAKPWQSESFAEYEMTDDMPYNEFSLFRAAK